MGNQHPLNEKKGGLRSPTIRKLAKDGRTWTPTEQVTRDKCLKQFCRAGRKGVEVSSGNSEAYKRGWALMFGTPEEKAMAQAQIDAEKATAAPDLVNIRDMTREELLELFPPVRTSEPAPPWSITITGIDP